MYADDDGHVDMRTTESVGGTYEGVDGMGLFWSMVKRESARNYRCILKDGSRELNYSFKAFDGHVDLKKVSDDVDDNIAGLSVMASAKCQRYISKNVQRIPLNNGKLFVLFY